MSEQDDLARRFFALWAEYLTALVADRTTVEPLGRWLTLAAGSLTNVLPVDARVGAGSPADAAPPAGASGERDAAVAELARRVDELTRRVAEIERKRGSKRGERAAVGSRGRNRTPRP